jgi:hypothetical protein
LDAPTSAITVTGNESKGIQFPSAERNKKPLAFIRKPSLPKKRKIESNSKAENKSKKSRIDEPPEQEKEGKKLELVDISSDDTDEEESEEEKYVINAKLPKEDNTTELFDDTDDDDHDEEKQLAPPSKCDNSMVESTFVFSLEDDNVFDGVDNFSEDENQTQTKKGLKVRYQRPP